MLRQWPPVQKFRRFEVLIASRGFGQFGNKEKIPHWCLCSVNLCGLGEDRAEIFSVSRLREFCGSPQAGLNSLPKCPSKNGNGGEDTVGSFNHLVADIIPSTGDVSKCNLPF